MGLNTKIGWTDHTVNFWTGCTKVSPGCKFCYMYRDQERYGKNPTQVLQVKQKTINKVLKEAVPGERVFTNSWSDYFLDDTVANAARPAAWDVIRTREDLTWQILTKRMDNVARMLPDDWQLGKGWHNVQLGFSAENQDTLKERYLQWVDSNATERVWISAEPLLGPLDLSAILPPLGSGIPTPIMWVVIGGESGNDNGKYTYRPCELKWIEDLVNQCKEYGIPVFVKQMGTHIAKQLGISRHGAEPSEWPEHLQVQEFPEEQYPQYM